MPSRLIAVGDVHGCLPALTAVLEAVGPQPDDTLVFLGDYVDRGPDSRGVLETMLRLSQACRLVPLLGNHDELFMKVCAGANDLRANWLIFGGEATLASYGNSQPEHVPQEHLRFIRNCRMYYETDDYLFVHGSYHPELPMAQQSPRLMIWGKIRPEPPGPHRSGKTVIVGHTAQREGNVLDLGHLKCIDTCCYGDGYLTAFEPDTGRIWQADKQGRLRDQV
ncbi:MAG: serine/threonine protein phosphatase [Pirellulales bacterium]|nr:serine/threonine protein phosphatase [Pirellulales bacterium]